MKFKDLKSFVETCGLSDDAPVLVPARDHLFRPVLLQLDTVICEERVPFRECGRFSEDHACELTRHESRVRVLIIS